MKYKLFIVGRNGVGKDRIAQRLSRDFDLNLLCSHTDRPRRTYETNGENHIFNTKEEIDKILEKSDTFVYSESACDEYRCCANIRQFKLCDILVIDPTGIEYIKKFFPDEKFYIIHIYMSDEEERRERLRRRGDRYEDFLDKCKKENDIFNKFESEKNWDISFDNSEYFYNAYEILIKKIRDLEFSPILDKEENLEINNDIIEMSKPKEY